jgi:hypothetical protein
VKKAAFIVTIHDDRLHLKSGPIFFCGRLLLSILLMRCFVRHIFCSAVRVNAIQSLSYLFRGLHKNVIFTSSSFGGSKWFDSRWGRGIFLFTTASRTALEPTQPPIQWVPRALSRGVKRLGREADHLPPSSTEVTNAWSYTATPPIVLIAWCLVKHRDNFTVVSLTSCVSVVYLSEFNTCHETCSNDC